jgi:FkbM family methyltransferase
VGCWCLARLVEPHAMTAYGVILRLRSGVLRIFLRAYLRPTSRNDLVRLGSQYGGWWVPRGVLRPGAVAYCAGAGEDITFDLALLDRGLRVTTFDPTPRAISYVATTAPGSTNFRFRAVGWWNAQTNLRFYAPRNPAHVSHSVVNLQSTHEYFTAAVAPVHILAEQLGDEVVDLIKMDIEGAEYAVLDSLIESGPLPKALCVEFDQPQPVRRTLAAIRKLQAAGFSLRRIEGWNYTFSRI